jgi:hypothetical protein
MAVVDAWEPVRLAANGPIVAMRECATGAWVLVRDAMATQLLFVTVDGEVRLAHTVDIQLTRIRVYDDGRIYAAGDATLVRFDGAWHEDPIPAIERVSAVWADDGVYVLGARELLHFDGRWHSVDLRRAPDVRWADGDGRDGFSVIVGTDATHSCIASGRGTQWTREGCGSFYLYKVRVASSMRAFALGGDSLWERDRGSWSKTTYVKPQPGFPCALALVEDRPFTIELGLSGAHQPVLGTYDGTWHRLPFPPGARMESIVACRMPDGRILTGDQAGALWRTCR